MQLAVTAREKENVRRKLVVTAKKLRLKAAQLAITAKEKETVRRKLMITARKLRISHETLEKKVLQRTKDLEQMRAKDEAILASIGDGLVATDKAGRILLVNKAFERLLGWKEADVRGKSLSAVTPMRDSVGKIVSQSQRPVTKMLKDGSAADSDAGSTLFYVRKDGSSFPVAGPAASGTGIGLYMVYNIVRLIGGKISFVSQENVGTTFTLLFPS